MCWVETIENLDIQVADKNIEVYKIVLEATKQSCKSCIQGFIYEVNTIPKTPPMELKRTNISSAFAISNIICVEKAYHSYTKVQHTLKRIDKRDYPHKYKGLIIGDQLAPIKIDNPLYVATFVIPKGSEYAINWRGEIISNQIIYTGKYLKL